MTHPSPIRVHVYISGTVQGVGYRYSTLEMAQRLSLKGWVRNLPDDRVEAVFEGEPATIEQMLAWCRQGPPAARVQDVTISQESYDGLQTFEIRR
jgi:acylphosphatase